MLSFHEFLSDRLHLYRLNRLWCVVALGYPEISILNPQTRYFHQNVNFHIFEKGYFWGCDLENLLFEKMVLWIWSICWIWVIFMYTQLFVTSDHQNRPYWPIYLKVTFQDPPPSFVNCSLQQPKGAFLRNPVSPRSKKRRFFDFWCQQGAKMKRRL